MFDWLKDIVYEKKKKPAATSAKAKVSGSHIQVDSRSYPLVNLSPKGFMAGDFDPSLAVGQNAQIAIVVDDAWGKFSFTARCTITAADAQGRFGGSFSILPPEIEQVLGKYAKNKSARPPGK